MRTTLSAGLLGLLFTGCAMSHEPYRLVLPDGTVEILSVPPADLAARCIPDGHVLVVGPDEGCSEITVSGRGNASEGPFGDHVGVPVRILRRGGVDVHLNLRVDCDNMEPFTIWVHAYDRCEDADSINGMCMPGASETLMLLDPAFPDGTAELLVSGDGVDVTLEVCPGVAPEPRFP